MGNKEFTWSGLNYDTTPADVKHKKQLIRGIENGYGVPFETKTHRHPYPFINGLMSAHK